MERLYKHKIKDIIEAMQVIESFIEGMDYDYFCQDIKTCSATIRQIEIISNAAKIIPENKKREYSHLLVSELSQITEVLVHEADNCRSPKGRNIDYQVVWKTIKEVFPSLQQGFKYMYVNV